MAGAGRTHWALEARRSARGIFAGGAVAAREPALHLHLLIALVKFDRFEWCLEKATELGVNEITPLIAARTDKALVAAAAKRHARWERIVLESAQQSRRLRPPKIARG